MKKFYITIFIAVVIFILVYSCQLDHGLKPVNYGIKGTIHFYKGNPPENTDRIEVFAIKEFPPQDPQNFLYLGRSGALDYQGKNKVEYEIQVSPTSYELVGLLWKEKNQDWNLTGLMGFYSGGFQSFFPDTVFVSRDDTIADSVDIYANWNVVSKDAWISGNIRYQGTWPEDTSLLILGIYPIEPKEEFQYILFENVDYAQPLFVDSSTYRLPVNSGVYQYVGVFWVGKNVSNFSDIIKVGFYKAADNPGNPGRVVVDPNQNVENIDIVVDFNQIDQPKD